MEIEGKFVNFHNSKEENEVKILLRQHVNINLHEKVYDAAYDWCENNCSSYFSSTWYSNDNECNFYFDSIDDAVIFKLTWAGTTIKDLKDA
jgi:hypothetical protein